MRATDYETGSELETYLLDRQVLQRATRVRDGASKRLNRTIFFGKTVLIAFAVSVIVACVLMVWWGVAEYNGRPNGTELLLGTLSAIAGWLLRGLHDHVMLKAEELHRVVCSMEKLIANPEPQREYSNDWVGDGTAG